MTSDTTNAPHPDQTEEVGEFEETARLEADAPSPEEAVLKEGVPRRLGTFRSLGHRDYRYFFIGALLSNVGTWMQMIAQSTLVVFVLKGTAISVGLVNFASTVPVFFLSLPAGAVADRINRRRLLIGAQALLLLQAMALGWLTQQHLINMPVLLAIVFAGGLVVAFMFPAWQATLPDLVPKRDLMNAIALNSAQFNSARLVGPAIASLVLARFGYASVFYINGVSFLAVIAALAVIHPHQEIRAGRGEGALQVLTGGLRYARENPCVAAYLLTIAISTVFGFFYVSLMPLVAKSFGIGPAGVGYLMAAAGLGAVAGALAVASLPHETRKDVLVKVALLFLGILLIGFAFSRSVWLSAVLLVGVGGAFMATTSGSNTAIQSTVPHHIRGRIMALFVLAFMGMMPFSALLGGVLGERFGIGPAIAMGGAVLVAHAALLILRPSLLQPREGAC